MNVADSTSFEFDVALSFAGEDRTTVAQFAHLLRNKGVRVFYDEYEQATLWGKNLYDHLSEIYSKKAKFCVMFLSSSYANKAWTTLERQHAQVRAFQEKREYILPVRLDDTSIPGVPATIGYIDLRGTSAEALASLVVDKLKNIETVVADDDQRVTPLTLSQSSSTKRATMSPRSVAMSFLFADVRDYSKLNEYQISRFLDVVIDRMATIFSQYQPTFCNTWGDATFCVYDNPQHAASCGLDLCDAFRRIIWEQEGLPSSLAIRVALHFGACHFARNPITNRDEYLGVNVNLAARIEPIVGSNQVWATDRFVSSLERDYRQCLHLINLGKRELFKGWEPQTLIRLSRYPIELGTAQAGSYYHNPAFLVRGLHHVNLPVRNLDASVRFYRDVLQLRQASDPEIMDQEKERPDFGFPGAWFEFPNGQQLHLIPHEEANEPVTFRKAENLNFKDSHFAVQVQDYDAMHAILNEALRKGHVREIRDGPRRFQCYILDPDLHVVEITGFDGPGPKRVP